MKEIKIIMQEGAKLPDKEFDTSAGYDLYTCEDTTIKQGRHVVRLGISVQLPKGYGMLIFGWSGMTSKGMKGYPDKEHYLKMKDKGLSFRYDCDVNLGLVDADYTGEIGVLMNNHDNRDFFIPKGQSIAQAIIIPCASVAMQIVTELDQTERGKQGFNS